MISFANSHLIFKKVLPVLILATMAVSGFGDFSNLRAAEPGKKSADQSVAQKTSDTKNSQDKKEAKNKGQKEKTASPLESLPLPVGHDLTGINLPWYDMVGHLQMNFHIAMARRVDKQHLVMTDLSVSTYDVAGKPDMTIKMPSCVLDLDTQILTSTKPVTIYREDFKITGAKMEFNTQTHRGKFVGKIKMLIYNHSTLKTKGGS